MPRATKAETQFELICIAHDLLEASALLEDLNDTALPLDDPEDDLLEDTELLELAAVMMIQGALEIEGDGTRGAYNQFPKSLDWFPISLQQPDRWFRGNYRMGRVMFDNLVSLLAQNPIFHSPKRRQRHVKFQLAAFLIRYGQRGSPVFDVASKLGLGFGTVHLYCRRVTRALRELRSQHLGWLSEERKKIVSQHIETSYGFENCVGSGDGCQIRMGIAPGQNPDEFLSRKKEYSVCVLSQCEMLLISSCSSDKYASYS
ncbi:hypothetical protein C8R42DRAFT_313172 [Lentinula raphanica]|nr:hypothetical protein C8R42DRAFT_313172 [Lentinula raphanica]